MVTIATLSAVIHPMLKELIKTLPLVTQSKGKAIPLQA